MQHRNFIDRHLSPDADSNQQGEVKGISKGSERARLRMSQPQQKESLEGSLGGIGRDKTTLTTRQETGRTDKYHCRCKGEVYWT